MITLQTGVPGSGKTLRIVSELKNKIDKEWAGRKIFIDGVPELTIQTEPIPDGHSIADMNVWLQWPENHGSLVIIDEAQRLFPPRSSSSKTPELIEWLHVHRHSGIDIILISQMPTRIDKQVRDLVGAHYHIHENALGLKMLYFWDYCANNPKSEMRNARPALYKFDKSAFSLYKSANVHTKIKKPRSRLRWFFPLMIFVLIGSVLLATKLVTGFAKNEPDNKNVSDSVKSGIEANSVDISKSVGQKLGGGVVSLDEKMLQPTLENHPESKPLYDKVRQVQTFEFPVACIAGGSSGCSCYSEQGTKIKEIDLKTCKHYVLDGLPFNPYKSKKQERYASRQQSQQLPSSANDSSVLELDGHAALTLNNEKFGDAPEAQ